MNTDPAVLMPGAVAIFGIGLCLGALMAWLGMRKRLRPVVPAQLDDLLAPPAEPEPTKRHVDGQIGFVSILDGVPQFGRPEVVIYRRAEWEEDLRCNGERCPTPELQEGQAIWLVPIPSGHLPLCLDCTPAPIAMHP